MNTNFDTVDTIINNKLNASSDITCSGAEIPGGKVFSGIYINKGLLGGNNMKYANCSDLKSLKKVGDLEKGGMLGNVCDCEMVNIKDGIIQCPLNKFLKAYYPSKKKGSCCTPCVDSKLKTKYNDDFCQTIELSEGKENVMCPNGYYLSGVDLNKRHIKCCKPELYGAKVVEKKENDEKCMALGLDNCDDYEKYKAKCNMYGLKNCHIDEIKDIENKCEKYGLRYNKKDGSLINPHSNMICHESNIKYLDDFCDYRGIEECNLDKINNLKETDKYFWILLIVLTTLIILTFMILMLVI